MSDFSGLRLALTALEAHRRGLELSAQNAANVNTEGYSRQRLDLVNIGAPAVPALWSKFAGDGGGVKVEAVTRFRDQFMEIRAALEHGSLAGIDAARATMERIQQMFDEPSDTGIGKQMADFWSGFDDVANHPDDPSSRTQLLERASTLVTTLNGTSRQLSQLASDQTSELASTVAEINATSAAVAQLNDSIKANTIAGIPVNDLMDQRDLFANKLASLSGATVRTGEFGQVGVYVSGNALVQEGHASSLVLDTTGASPVVRWTSDNSAANFSSGKAGGELQAINVTIPAYLARVDNVATTLRDSVNGLHGAITGNIAVGNQNQSAAGNLQFDVSVDGGAFTTVTVVGDDWSGVGGDAALQTALQDAIDTALGAGNATATVTGGAGSALAVGVVGAGTHTLQVKSTDANTGFATLLGTTGVGTDGIGGRQFFTGTDSASLALSSDVSGNPAAVAAATASGGALDGSRALDLADLASAQAGADASYRQLIVRVGVDTQTAQRRADIQQKTTDSLDSARNAQSGVNLDEEMTNMVEFQHAYEAAARFLTVIDQMLDTLINRTGRAG
jgi:flagellar hook-associated protein 1 FlgK